MLGRIGVPVMAFVVAIGVLLGSAGQAVAAPQPVAQSPEQAKVAELQAEYKAEASAEDYRKAVETYEKLVAGEPDPVEQPASMCVTIPKWVVVGYAWYVIVAGGASAAVGGLGWGYRRSSCGGRVECGGNRCNCYWKWAPVPGGSHILAQTCVSEVYLGWGSVKSPVWMISLFVACVFMWVKFHVQILGGE